MKNVFVAAVVLLLLAGLGSPASAAKIAMFNDGGFVDTGNEAANLEAVLLAAGHSVNTFTGVSENEWATAIADNDLIVIPDQEFGDLFAAMPFDTRFTLQTYVLSGGGLIVHGTTGISRLEILLNSLFMSALVRQSPVNPGVLNPTTATGTAFEGGPASVPQFAGISGENIPSLPVGGASIYADGTTSVVTKFDFGGGRVVAIGFDWSFLPSPPAWINVLGRAITHVTTQTFTPIQVAVFADSLYVDAKPLSSNDLGEALWVSNNLEKLGHAVTLFDVPALPDASPDSAQAQADEFAAALVGKAVLVVPELENFPSGRPNLAPDLSPASLKVLQDFVSSGGALVLNGEGGSRAQQFVNKVFGFTTARGLGGATTRRAPTVGTAFAAGPATLTSQSGTYHTTSASLPPWSLNLYSNGPDSGIWTAPFGRGRVVFLAHDWFSSNATRAHLDWSAMLGAAVDFTQQAGQAVTLPAATGPAQTDMLITATMAPDISPASAQVFFRVGGTTAFDSAVMLETPVGSGTWTGTIPGTLLDVQGLQYYVEISDGANLFVDPPNAPNEVLASMAVEVVDSPIASLPAGVHDLLGVPLRAANADPVAVFDEFGGVYDNSVWRYGVRNASDTGYDEPGGAASATPGQGFWLIARDATVVRVSGTSSNLTGNTVVTLHTGWNQISNPFAFAIDSDDVILPTAVSRNFWSWDGTTHQFAASRSLPPREGFWLENTSAGSQEIEFPPVGGTAALRFEPTIPGVIPDDVAGWSVEVAATVGAVNDRNNRFGMREDGTADRDAFDFGDPPQPPGSYAGVSFLTDRGKALLTDYRSDTEEGATWDLILQSDLAGEDYRVDFSTERSLPAGWSLVALGGSGGERVDLTNTPSLSGLVTSDAFQTTWKIVAGPPEYVAEIQADLLSGISSFAFSVPRPNPIRSGYGTTFDFAVPQATHANIKMFDVSGRLVRNLLQGPVNRGEHRVFWDGTDGGGRRAAAGVYFVKVQTEGFSTTRKVTVLN